MNPVSTCKQDGFCDGNGACRNYAGATVCVAGSCTGATFTTQRTCDGAGTCLPSTTGTCPGSFACDSNNLVCRTSCSQATSSTDCASPATCSGTFVRAQGQRRRLRHGQRMRDRLLPAGRLLRQRLPGHVQVVRVAGRDHARRLLECTGYDAGRPLRDDRDLDLRHRRHLRRQRRLPPLLERYPVRGRHLPHRHRDPDQPAHLRWRGQLRRRDHQGLLSVSVRRCFGLQDELYGRDVHRGLPGTQLVSGRDVDLRQEADRRELRGRRRVRLHLLLAERLLRQGLQRNLPVVRAHRQGRHLLAGARRQPARSGEPVSRERRRATCGSQRLLRRLGQLPATSPNGTVCVAPSCSAGNTLVQPRLCNGGGTCQTSTSGACPGFFNCNDGT